MNNIHINGELFSFDKRQAGFLDQALSMYFQGQTQSTFAIALNGEFIGKTDYAHTPIKNGDSIDIMLPIQGG
ncbi:sulfur carrier protein ThiS [Thalassotalea sp. PLHSN55]|uniref:sulfur carrier protein ThiS n=1 Tax=Thalassotalea sp. PLHSN55 TaxID=3435888 RepID=UPI003F840EFA